ncbi:hypothetical protein [Kingella oralis]
MRLCPLFSGCLCLSFARAGVSLPATSHGAAFPVAAQFQAAPTPRPFPIIHPPKFPYNSGSLKIIV